MALDVGEGTGVLIIHAGAAEHLYEIEISPADGSRARTHAAVRARELPGHTVYAAVYPGLAPGVYTVWRDGTTPHGSARVPAGRITEYRWHGHRSPTPTASP